MTRAGALPLIGFAVLSLAATVAPFIALGESQTGFARILGTWPPGPLIGASAIAGGGALLFLKAQGWGHRRAGPSGLALVALLSALFVAPAILIDLWHPFPADLNVALPGALLFYPAMAFLAQCLFHLVPLALLVALTGGRGRAVPVIIGGAALIEPIFQVLAPGAASLPAGLLAVLALHLFAFNLFQLLLFRRYGFVVMFAARLVYYLGWHILWGSARLVLG